MAVVCALLLLYLSVPFEPYKIAPPLNEKDPLVRIRVSLTNTFPVMVIVDEERFRVSMLNPFRTPGKLVLPVPLKVMEELVPPVRLPEVLLIAPLLNVSRFEPMDKAPLVRYKVPVMVLLKLAGNETLFELLIMTFGGPLDVGHSDEAAV